MDRKDAISRLARAGILPGAVGGGIIGLAFTFVSQDPGDQQFMARLLLLFPLGALLGAGVGAMIGALIADHRYPP